MNRRTYRKILNNVMLTATGLCTLFTVSILFLILGYLVYNGGKSLDWGFFTRLPLPPGEAGGGMANGIVGSAEMVGLAALIGLPIGFMGGIYLAEFSGKTMGFAIRYTADLLNGVPSIVIGIFAWALVVVRLHSFSGLAGAIALAMMLIPISLRTTEQFLSTVPNALREGALALGAPKWKVLSTVVVPAAMKGILTGMILGVARVAGETAPLLFTALNNQFWSVNMSAPMANLPVVIFQFALSPYADWQTLAWGGALLITVTILLLNILARFLASWSNRTP